MVVVLVNQDDLNRLVFKLSGEGNTSEPTANNNDAWMFRSRDVHFKRFQRLLSLSYKIEDWKLFFEDKKIVRFEVIEKWLKSSFGNEALYNSPDGSGNPCSSSSMPSGRGRLRFAINA